MITGNGIRGVGMNKVWISHYDQGVPGAIHCPDKTVYQLFEEAVSVL